MAQREPLADVNININVSVVVQQSVKAAIPAPTPRQRLSIAHMEAIPYGDAKAINELVARNAAKEHKLETPVRPRTGEKCWRLVKGESNRYPESKITYNSPSMPWPLINNPVRPHALEAEMEFSRRLKADPTIKRGKGWEASHRCGDRKCFARDHVVLEPGAINRSRDVCTGDVSCKCGELVLECQHRPKCIR